VKLILLLGLATVCFAASEPTVSTGSLKSVEGAINDRLLSKVNDPYDLLGTARGTYLEGYGAVFTFELNLVFGSSLAGTPFSPKVTDLEITTMHERKARKVEDLKETMRGLAASACKTLNGMPPEENVVVEAFLFSYRWENTRGLPHRIVLSVQKQKLLDAVSRHATSADIAALFTEQEL
jgi:hypothetical protein